MASRLQGKRVLITDCEVMMGPSNSEAMRRIAFRFRKWREDQQTWAALRHLDDRQLKDSEFIRGRRTLLSVNFPDRSMTVRSDRCRKLGLMMLH